MNFLTQILFSLRLEHIEFSEGLLVALLGILIVFSALLVLVGLLYVFSKVFSLNIFKAGFKKNKATEVKEDEVLMDDSETVAAITAAISIMLTNESESEVKPTFIIRSLKRLK